MSTANTYPSNAGMYYISGGASGRVIGHTTTAATTFDSMGTVTVGASNSYSIESASYTFTSTIDQYKRIFSAQCVRVGKFVDQKLEQLDLDDDDKNEDVVDSIAQVIDLVGEPAFGTMLMEARILRGQGFTFERLLLAIASSHHKETEGARLKLLQQYAADFDYRVRRAAVRALGRMDTEGAKKTLTEISSDNAGSEMGRFAGALLR